MEIVINNLTLKLKDDEGSHINKIRIALNSYSNLHFTYKIMKKAIDARKKNDILFVYSCLVNIDGDVDITKIKGAKLVDFVEEMDIPHFKMNHRPVIVGFGPSGMFAGLYLARAGLKPIILERGKKVEEREKDVALFKEKGIFSSLSNVCFGEGGAGTFSDGKLTTNVNDARIRFIINEFISHGASKEIYYEAHPHIGSDYLRIIVKNIREEINSLGGEVKFETTFTSFETKDDKVTSALPCGIAL